MRYDQIGLNVMIAGRPRFRTMNPRFMVVGQEPAQPEAGFNFAKAAATAAGMIVFLGLGVGATALVWILKGPLWALGTAVALGGGFYLFNPVSGVAVTPSLPAAPAPGAPAPPTPGSPAPPTPPTPPAPPVPPAPTQTPSGPAHFNVPAIATQDPFLYIRTNPDSLSTYVGVVPKGSPITILNSSGDYYFVSYQGVTGWSPKAFIDLKTITIPDRSGGAIVFHPINPDFSV